ncbi:MAG: sulfatase [Rubripirellula sp.]|nr:sulfatase [Rubripirellula sp.]
MSTLKTSFLIILLVKSFAALCSAAQPNILLIVSEDNGPEVGCYGDQYAKTPNLDRLADEGIRFDRAYVPQAGCSQSRASFLTGLYPHQHGQIGLATWGFRMYRKETPNLPRSLKAAGYRTGLIGKLHINPASAFPFDMHEIESANFQRSQLSEYEKYAAEFINAGDAPFFLSVNYPDAHDPWLKQVDGLPTEPQTKDDVRAMAYMGIDTPELRQMVADYYNCMSRLDSLVGDLLRTLERSGKADNTIVIYIGDHGADMLRGKRTCYEGGLRIPMMMRWPKQIAPQVRDEMVSTLDLMPTLIQASGARPIANLPGSKLQPLFQSGPAAWRTEFFAEYHTHAAAPNYFPQRSVRSNRYKLIESLLPNTVHPDYDKTIQKLHGDYTGQKYSGTLNLKAAIAAASDEVRKAYKLMRKPPRYQLYDLQQDPYEFKNLADDPKHSEVLSQLKQHLKQYRTETNDPLLNAENLTRLNEEVQSVIKKSTAKKHDWQYPNYLLGLEQEN